MADRIPGSSYSNPIRYLGHWSIYLAGLPPIPGAWRFQWAYVHDDYDGAPDYADDGPSDLRCGRVESVEAAKAEIDEWEENDASARYELQASRT